MRLELLGGLRAVEGENIVSKFRTHRSGMLLAYVALHPKQDHSRDALGELLWPDENSDKQRTRLRYELSVLRAVLGRDPFRADGNATLTLAPDVSCDVSDFKAEQLEAIRAGTPEKRLPHLRKAVALCRGDLLPGVYESWATEEQERFREAHCDVLTRLILDLEALGQYEEARAIRRDAAARFPENPLPPPPATVAPGYLGTPVKTPFFGRKAEIQFVREWLQRPGAARILTLTGMGGIGKTRLMAEAARDAEAIFVPLAEATRANQLWGAIAAALNLSLTAGVSPRMAIFRAMRERGKTVLLLDNLEQLFPDIAPLIQEMLDVCPAVRCLASSRRPLRIAAEREFPMDSLPDDAATALFLERARRARPDFASTERGRMLAREIAHLLEGVPLSLELAAARATVLGPAQIREALNEKLTFLVQIRHGTDKRHNSLRAALEWSVALLAPERRRTLGQIAVFRDGFTLPAAQIVCGNDPPALDALEDLILHSLLGVAFDANEESRYVLRGVIRDYAEELSTPDERAEAQENHHRFFAQIAQRLHERIRAQDEATGLRLLHTERENLRAAQFFAIEHERSDTLPVFFDGLAAFWLHIGNREDSLRLMDAVEPILQSGPPSARLTQLYGVRGADARRRGDLEVAWRCWQDRLALARALRNVAEEAAALIELVAQAIDQRDFTAARELLAECRESIKREGGPDRRMTLLILEARLALGEGDAARALELADAARTLREAGHAGGDRLYALHYLPLIYCGAEGGERAEASLREGIAAARSMNTPFSLGVLALELARLREKQGRRQEAGDAYRVAAGIHAELESRLQNESRDELARFRAGAPALHDVAGDNIGDETALAGWRTLAESLT